MDDLKVHALFLISNNYALKPIENLIKYKLNEFKISMTINCRNKADVYKYDNDVYFNVTIFFNYLFKKGILQTCYNKSLDNNKILNDKVIYYLSTDDESESSESDSIDESIDSRGNLKNFIGMMYGKSKWDELIAMEGKIRKQRQETLYIQRQRRRKFVEIVAWIVMGLIGFFVLIAFIMLLKAHTARAEPEHVVCRLVGCEKIEDQRWCVYRGAYNIQETINFRLDEWFPREFLCDFVRDAPRPPSMRETMKAIRESQK